MKIKKPVLLSLMLGSAFVPTVLAAQTAPAAGADCADPESVLACQGKAVLTQDAINAAFSRIPEDVRLKFIRDGALVDKMVKDLLQMELLAIDAEDHAYTSDPVVHQRMVMAARKELAEAWLEDIERQAPEADYAAIAHEDYLANPAAFTKPATVDVTHILISTDKRTVAQAEEIAVQVNARLQEDPLQFDALVQEYSDDPGKFKNGGKYTGMSYEQLAKPFAEAAFALQNPGDLSPLVETEYGIHLIRLDNKTAAELQPWDTVEEEATKKARIKHLSAWQANYLKKLMFAPIEFPEGSVEVMARKWFGEELEKAPIYTEEGLKLDSTIQE